MRAVTIIVQYLVRGVALAPLTSGELDRRSYVEGGQTDEDARVVSLLDQQLCISTRSPQGGREDAAEISVLIEEAR